MESRYRKLLLTIVLVVFLPTSGCGNGASPNAIPAGGEHLDKVAFWEGFPLPDDAEGLAVVEGYDLGFATRMIEPALFDFYATWLCEQGWRQQAPTEAMITPPRQVWRKDGAELLVEIQGLDDQGRTVVWLRVEER